MGTDYYAETILGFRAKPKDLFKTVEGPSCPHQHDFKFCPECGVMKKIVEGKAPIDEFVRGDGRETFRGLFIHTPVYFSDIGDDEEVLVIGVPLTLPASQRPVVCRVQESGEIDKISRTAEAIRKTLKGSPFEGKKISIFSVLRTSY